VALEPHEAARQNPKTHVCDSGLACYLCGISEPENLDLSPLRGAVVETYAFQNIHAIVNAFLSEVRICHYRSHDGYECNFVLETHKDLLAVEVKAGGRISPRDFGGLEALLGLEPRCKAGIFRYQGDTVVRLGKRLWTVPAGHIFDTVPAVSQLDADSAM